VGALSANGNGARPMTIPEVAKEAGVSKAAAYRWIADGKLPSYRFPGGKKSDILRVARKDFEAFLKGCYVRGPL
jgi:excisionase family DNA binding protein